LSFATRDDTLKIPRSAYEYLSISFCLVGVLLVLLGSVIRFPYSLQEDLRVRKSVDITKWFNADSGQAMDYPLFENGSMREIGLSPYGSKKYWYSVGEAPGYNDSLLQIDLGRAGPLTFAVADLSWEDHNIRYTVFNQTGGQASPVRDKIWEWKSYVWTSPWDHFGGNLGFIFQNPTDQDMLFTFNVTYHWYAKEQITLYNTLLDPNFAYVGIVLIGISIPLNAYPFMKNRETENSAKRS
jgi:hypothetical protein